MELSQFARNILFLRKEKGFMQSEMEARCGIKQRVWSNLENGISEPSITYLITISNLFGKPVDAILRDDLTKNVQVSEKQEASENHQNCTSFCTNNCTSNSENSGKSEHPQAGHDSPILAILERLDSIFSEIKGMREDIAAKRVS